MFRCAAADCCSIERNVSAFLFLQWLVPIPPKVRHDTSFVWLNVALFVVFVSVGTVIANIWGVNTTHEVRDWFMSGEEPDQRQRERTLRQPLVQPCKRQTLSLPNLSCRKRYSPAPPNSRTQPASPPLTRQ